MNQDYNKIAEQIKAYRKLRNISQDRLSELSGIHVSTIKKYESGFRNPKPDQLLKIANALNISANEFMAYDLSTPNDVVSVLIKLAAQSSIQISAQKDDTGHYIPESVQIELIEYDVRQLLASYLQENK